MPEHRFGLVQVQKMISQPALTADLMALEYTGPLAGMKVDVSAIIEALVVDGRRHALRGVEVRWPEHQP